MSAATRRPAPPLLRLERAGAIDAALALLAAIQFYYLAAAPPAAGYRPPAWLALPACLTWSLLTAGALAPLTRRRVARPGDLPPGAAPWLAGYGLAALAWLLLLFNTNYDQLWGFWHLVRFSGPGFAALASFLPLVLAPCWIRFARALRLALRRRTRRRLARPACALLPLLVPLAAALLWPDRAIMSDGWGIVSIVHGRLGLGPDTLREPGALILLREAAVPLRRAGLNAAESIGLVNAAAGLLNLLLVLFHQWRRGLTRGQLFAAGWLAAGTGALPIMLAGHIEVYPLLLLGVTATAVAGAEMIERGASPAWPALAFALATAGHGTAEFRFPAVLRLRLITLVNRGRGGGHAHARNRNRNRNRIPNPRFGFRISNFEFPSYYIFAHFLLWGLLVHGVMWAGLIPGLERPTLGGLREALSVAVNTGAENLTFIGGDRPSLSGQLAAILAPANLFKVVQLHHLLAFAPIVALAVLPFSRRRATSPGGRGATLFFFVAWFGYALYALTWHNDWAWIEDWDLFSAVGPLALLLALRLLMPAPSVTRIPLALAVRIGWWGAALALPLMHYNHSRATFLNSVNKVTWNAFYGEYIQRIQLEYSFPRQSSYQYENGRVTVSPPGGGEPLAVIDVEKMP